MVKPIPPHFGTAVLGEMRYARPELEEEFDSVMTGTNGAKLFGLRRIGKSSEALACAQRLAGKAGAVVQINAEGRTSETKLLLDILNALPAKGWRERITKIISDDGAIASAVREGLKKFTGSEADIQAYFAPIMNAVEHSIDANDGIVLVIDEFPWLCRSILETDPVAGRSRVDVLLAALRRWRGKGVRMLLLGSIGMAALGRHHKLDLSHLIDLTPLEVPPLTPEQAAELVDALVAGGGVTGWTAAHTAQLIDESVALYPSVIQRAFQQLSVGRRAARLERIADLFAEKIRPDLDATFFTQFDHRLQLYKGFEPPMNTLLPLLLRTVLAPPRREHGRPELRQAAPADADDADFGDALAILHEDGFLSLRAPRGRPQQWRPASSLVTSWWDHRHGG